MRITTNYLNKNKQKQTILLWSSLLTVSRSSTTHSCSNNSFSNLSKTKDIKSRRNNFLIISNLTGGPFSFAVNWKWQSPFFSLWCSWHDSDISSYTTILHSSWIILAIENALMDHFTAIFGYRDSKFVKITLFYIKLNIPKTKSSKVTF